MKSRLPKILLAVTSVIPLALLLLTALVYFIGGSWEFCAFCTMFSAIMLLFGKDVDVHVVNKVASVDGAAMAELFEQMRADAEWEVLNEYCPNCPMLQKKED